MRPSRFAVLAAVACCAALTLLPASADAKTCGKRKGSATIVKNSAARVYRVHNAYLGCAVGGRKSFILDPAGATVPQGLKRFTLAGPIVAYVRTLRIDTGADANTTYQYVLVVDLRTGLVIHYARALDPIPSSGDPDQPYSLFVTDLKVNKTGSVAWIGATAQGGPGDQVHVFDVTGNFVVDNHTGHIDAGSLTLGTHTVNWKRDGVTQTSSVDNPVDGT